MGGYAMLAALGASLLVWRHPLAALMERAAAILALIGVINLPIIKFSVDWWNTLHQPASITRLDAPAIHNSILVPLLWMAVALLFLFVWLVLLRTETEIDRRRLENAEAAA
jgi:heme exporter protein C